MIRIEKICADKKRFLDLLLLADEQEYMIDRYLADGELFVLYDGDLKSVGVVLPLDHVACELKNIATYPQYQGLGYGRALLHYLFDFYRQRFQTMLVGTGDVPSMLSFYASFGFEVSHRVKDFFVEHYDHPMFEEGVQLVDMVYLRKVL